MKNPFFLFLLFVSISGSAQNLTGTWLGYGGGTDFIKMVITHRGDSLYGYTYDEGDGYCKAVFKGRYDRTKKRLTGRGIEMIENTPNHVLVDYDLYFESFQSADYLRELRGNTIFDRFFGEGKPLVLKRVSRKTDKARPPTVSKQPAEKPRAITPAPPPKVVPKPAPKPVTKTPPKPPVKTVPKTDPKINNRVDEVSKTTPVPVTPEIKVIRPTIIQKSDRPSKLAGAITTTADSLTLTLYDNGEIDGDTVSVYFNNMKVLDRYRISDKGKTLIFPLANGMNTIEMFAHNLGMIPPNTALLVITSGKERHELRTSADLKTNARIDINKTE